jgi:hypothetical protein
MVTSSQSSADELHKLSNKWTIYAHLPHDTDWTLASYKTLFRTDKIEEFITLTESLPDQLISNCMLFVMKDNIKPIWEDVHNKNGGCFSYKISNKSVPAIWRKFSYKLVGNTLFKSDKTTNNVNGITISPKKNFCIVKLWFSDCTNQNPDCIDYFKGVDAHGCLFKRHFTR